MMDTIQKRKARILLIENTRTQLRNIASFYSGAGETMTQHGLHLTFMLLTMDDTLAAEIHHIRGLREGTRGKRRSK